MGDYTGIRFKAELKPEVAQIISESIEIYNENYEAYRTVWTIINSKLREIDIIIPATWFNFRRINFIPFGGLAYMPEDWEFNYDISSNIWDVCCSAKKTQNAFGVSMMEFFAKSVLPILISSDTGVEIYDEIEGLSSFDVSPKTPL